MTTRTGHLHLGAFLYPTGHHIAAWRHPDSQADAGVDFGHYVRLAQAAEAAKFDLVFLADGVGTRGDDVEFLWRANDAGARTATVVDAAVRHPSVGDLGTRMMFGRTTYNHSPSDLKHYCMARNNTVNLRTYRGWPHVLMFWTKTLWFYLFTRPRPSRLPMSVRAAYAGLRGDFSGHRRYVG